MKVQVCNTNAPAWRDITIKSKLPAELVDLGTVAHNLWWSWDTNARKLWRELDIDLWRSTGHNPVAMLETMNYDQLQDIANDPRIMNKVNDVVSCFKAYMAEPKDTTRPSVAYFCMEYGLTACLKIYSGGLGILAGDYVKEASDSNVDFCAVGFLYRYGYFTQTLSADGNQEAEYEAQKFDQLPIEPVRNEDGTQLELEVPYHDGLMVYSRVWQVNVGRAKLYLLDTDYPKNSEYDRSITHRLYGGDWENRIKQEYLLGIGGVLLLNKLGIKKDVYHANEGHAALMGAQRMADLIEKEGLNFQQALEVVRASSLYTCHTPVPAGHDYFEEGIFYKYMSHFAGKLGIEWADFMNMGRETPGEGKFSMSVFALNTCQEANGVSWLHGAVSRNMFQPVWKGYAPEELHVGYVTNGVHHPTWAASEWKAFYTKLFGPNYYANQTSEEMWKKIYDADDAEIWDIRKALKKKLFDYIKEEVANNLRKKQENPAKILQAVNALNPNALTIGFARRFATYKRAHLLFTDLERLDKIVNNPERPVQFIFAGKAHPADGGGQGLIRRIVEISRMPQFVGKVVFVENYDMDVAKRLVVGVDIWMNTPTRPLEASGTSGEKAVQNGVLNLSVLDGWWYEGYREGAGWALTDKRTFQNQALQDQLDAETIYTMLETEIVPLYFDKNEKGFSPKWVRCIKDCLAKITPNFTMKRQLDDYYNRFYIKEAARSKRLCADNYKLAKEIAAWKEKVAANWDTIEVLHVELPENVESGLKVGGDYVNTVVVDGKEIADSIGVDLVVAKRGDGSLHDYRSFEMEVTKREGSVVTFQLRYPIKYSGSYKFAFRLFPKNEELPHRMDFAYTKWF
ncbi:MAG: alpha-glucan family phosphorylase [Bacteroidales bacterium]|nr:alpha-glucan family phosphorylase [Bacteroidales bacterium]